MSSLKDLASLIMIPSLVKDGRLDTVKPLGNSIIHPDATGNNDGTDGSTPAEGNFTFTRCGGAAGCDLAATRVDVNGLIEKGRENLLLQSNQFDNAYWTKSASTISIGQADPNGGSNAFKIVEDTSTNYHRISGGYTMVSGNVYATSVTAKAAGRNFLTLSNNVSSGTTIFNLTNGNVEVQESGVVSASTTSLGGGWYRCEMVAVGNASGAKSVFIGADNNGVIGTYTGDGTSGVLIYQSQLESSLVATPYIETGASTAQAGILEDLPRLDYSGGASCPSLLLEPQRTNRLANSENGYGWTTSNVSVLPFDGGINGKYFQLTSAGSASRFNVIQNNWVNLAAATYTASVFAKKGTADEIILTTRANFASQSAYSTFNLTSGTVANNGVTGSIEPYSDGWYRCSITFANPGSYTDFASFAYGFNFNASSTDTLFVTAPQSEIGSYPTSYIPTMGSAVTRSGDVCTTSSVPSLIGQTEGTIFWQGEVNYGGIDAHAISLSGSTSNFSDAILLWRSITGRLSVYIQIGGVPQFGAPLYYDDSASISPNDKYAIGYAQNDLVVYKNGTQVISASSGNIPATNFLLLNEWVNINGHKNNTKQALLFKTRLTNAELAALTTI